MMRGLIIQSAGKWYKAETDEGVLDCRLRGKMRLNDDTATNPVAVGDNVQIVIQSDGTGLIERVEPRRNILPRQATRNRRGEQVLAANVDRAWVVVSIRKPAFKFGFIDRFLVTCEAYDVPAGIILNKMDLTRKRDLERADKLMKLYTGLGYKALSCSIEDPQSLKRLQQELEGNVSVFIGPSGVGKSSLLNALDPELNLQTGSVSDYSEKGQHTTTLARLISLRDGGRIVDTPGIRELGLVQISPSELSHYFPEISSLAEECRFYNCTHSHEPGCRVMEGYEEGLVDPERYHSYLQILESLPEHPEP